MAKPKRRFVCQNCGYTSPKWLGRCPSCQMWDVFDEEVESPTDRTRRVEAAHAAPLYRLTEVRPPERWVSGMTEWDRVLGGGLLPGSVYLVGGDPGIGKSTLMLQVLDRYLQQGRRCLYIAGEESPGQIRQRTERLGVRLEDLWVCPDPCLESVQAVISRENPQIVVVDSIQMMYTERHPSPAGTIRQLRECGLALIHMAKQHAFALLLVGHVTKGGTLAGPRLLEHMVDGVLYFEGDRYYSFRILRAVKNRYGPVQEVGIFEMTEHGLREVADPSLLWIDFTSVQARVGAVLCPVMEGARSIIVEVQALVAPTVFPTGRRTALGIDLNRLYIVSAVLERRLGYPLSRYDVYVKLTGGFHSRDPALDLAIAVAMFSAVENRPVSVRWAACGELALTGEVRRVPYMSQRLQSLARLGVDTCFVGHPGESGTDALRVVPVRRVEEIAAEWDRFQLPDDA